MIRARHPNPQEINTDLGDVKVQGKLKELQVESVISAIMIYAVFTAFIYLCALLISK